MIKNIAIFLMFLMTFCVVSGQDSFPKSKKDGKKGKALEEKLIMEKIGELLEDTAFMFNATDMFVRGGGSMSLGYKCDVQVKNETIKSYLPFVGRAYYLSTNTGNPGYDFTSTVQQYHFNKSKSGYDAVLKVKNGSDLLKYNFYITKTGYATLIIGSSRRQSISYYGCISDLQ